MPHSENPINPGPQASAQKPQRASGDGIYNGEHNGATTQGDPGVGTPGNADGADGADGAKGRGPEAAADEKAAEQTTVSSPAGGAAQT